MRFTVCWGAQLTRDLIAAIVETKQPTLGFIQGGRGFIQWTAQR